MKRNKIFGFFTQAILIALFLLATMTVRSHARVLVADDIFYVYDVVNRLIEVHYPDKVIHYTYDDAGNRTGMTVEILAVAPSINALSPWEAIAGGTGFTLKIYGSNFANNSIVQWNGVDRATTYISPTELRIQMLPADIAAVGTSTAVVVNSTPTVSVSNSRAFNTVLTATPICVAGSIPSVQSLTAVTTTVQVNTAELAGMGATDANLTVTYNPAVLTPLADPTFGVTLGSVGTSNGGGRTLTVNNPSAGTLTISISGSLEMQGSGALVNLNFNVVGLPGTSSALNYTSLQFNSAPLCGSISNGSVTVIPGTITGTVTYGNAVSGPAPPRYVSNVLITGSGSPNVSTSTIGPGATAGNYSLTGFGNGSYTIAPSKSGGQNGITSFDAAKIAQHVAGISLLTGNQLIVADTSNNGAVTSFDAAQIAKYVTSTPPFGITGTWKFTPVNRPHPNVFANFAGEDYTALLMGEVSGNWTNTGARPANEGPPELAVKVALPQLTANAGSELIIPITVEDAANKGVIAYEFDLRYDPTVIQPQSEPIQLIGTVSSKLYIETNAKEPGLLRVAVFGAMPIESDGVLLNLRFTAIGAPGSLSLLTWERLLFNEGDPWTQATNGQVQITKAKSDQADTNRTDE